MIEPMIPGLRRQWLKGYNTTEASDFITDIFHIFAQNIDCGYTLELEPPHQGGSNEYPQSMFWINQRTNGPDNAHLKPDPGVLSHHEMTLTLNTHTPLLNS